MSDPRNQRNPTQKQIYSINKTPGKEKKERQKEETRQLQPNVRDDFRIQKQGEKVDPSFLSTHKLGSLCPWATITRNYGTIQ